MARIKEQLAANIIGHWDFRTGSFKDQTGGGSDGSPTNDPVWTRSRRGRASAFNGIDQVVDLGTNTLGPLAEGASGITMVVTACPQNVEAGSIPMLFSETIGVASNGFNMRLDQIDSDTYNLRVGGRSQAGDAYQSHQSTAVYNYGEEHHFVGVLDYANDMVHLYVDGVLEGSTAATFGSTTYNQGSPTRTDAIGGASSSANLTSSLMNEVLVLDTPISAAQASQLYQEHLEELALTSVPQSSRVAVPEPVKTDNIAFQLTGDTVDGVFKNIYGIETASVDAGVDLVPSSIYNTLVPEFSGSDNEDINFGDVTFMDGDTQATILMTLEPTALGTFDGFYTKGTSVSSRVRFGLGGTGAGTASDILLNIANGAASSSYTTNEPLQAGCKARLAIVFNGGGATDDDKLKLYVNGTLQTLTHSVSPGASIPNVSTDFLIGNDNGSTARVFNGMISDVQYHSGENYTQADVTRDYKNLFGATNLNLLGEDWNISTTNETGGSLSNSPFIVDTGSWKIEDSTTYPGQKRINCKSTGNAYISSAQAFGTWDFTVFKEDASETQIVFIADTIGTTGASGQDGYLFELQADEAIEFARVTNGSTSTLFRTNAGHVSAETSLRFRITRDSSGEFTLYEFVSGAWQLIADGATGSNPVTETTHVSSSYMNLDFPTGDEIENIKLWPTIQDPTA